MKRDPLQPLRTLVFLAAMALIGCTPPERSQESRAGNAGEIMTESERAAVAGAVEQAWSEMMAGARALDPERIRAGYVDDPVVTINGVIIEDFDRDQFDETRRWLRSLRHFDARYDHVHLEVLSPAAAVATMNHHLRWRDSTGTTGEWDSAWTAVFRRIEGRWKIVYSHESTPQPAS